MPTQTMNVVLAALLLSLPPQTNSFSPAARLPLTAHGGGGSNLLRPTAAAAVVSHSSSLPPLAAKRRRRKDASVAPTTTQSDDLPDFDLDEEEEAMKDSGLVAKQGETARASSVVVVAPSSTRTTTTPVRRGAGLNSKLAEEVGGNVDGLDEDTILEAMRGKAGGDSWQPPRSIQDTLSDRSLEKFMNFEKMIEKDGGGQANVELPDFDEVIARRKQKEAVMAVQEGRMEDAAMLIDTEGMGKKAAKAAQRRAAAMQREAEMEETKSPFEDLNILKLLENGAWVGIGLLVLWEFYINSPFFERAAPLIPVVYDQMPPGM